MVDHHLENYPVVNEGLDIQIFGIAIGIVLEVLAVDHLGNRPDIFLDFVEHQAGEAIIVVRVLYSERDAVLHLHTFSGRLDPLDLIVVVEVAFQKESVLARHTVAVRTDLLDQQIVADVLPVHHEFHALAVRSPVQRCHRTHFVGYQVAHQCPVHKVGQKDPPFVLRQPEDGLLLVKLDQIRLLGPGPSGVSTSADGARHLFQITKSAHPVYLEDRFQIVLLGHDLLLVFRVNVNHRKPCPDLYPAVEVIALDYERLGIYHRALRQPHREPDALLTVAADPKISDCH